MFNYSSLLFITIGLNEWKEQLESPDYDWELVKARLDQLREIRKLNKGQSAMIFALRTSLARNLGDMGNLKVGSYNFTCKNAHFFFFVAILSCTYRNKELDNRLYRRSS